VAKELSKTYNPDNLEQKWYKVWEDSDCFKPNEDLDTSFTIMIPPPNVTGILHLGHVLNNTIQDILIRKARMEGKNTLWLPGTDHASIATEAKVTKYLKDQNIHKKEIGREKFLEHSWEWTEKYSGTIIKQLKRLGCSCDWSRQRFTMDDDYYNAVIETFVKLYNDGLIYKGERMINWDPLGKTALSDEEVIHKESNGKLWHLKYPIKDSDDFLVVATTRPETMLGDTGVAVNPNDKRYKAFIGKKIILPIVNKEIPIFSDEFVDMEFGTGCVKVTPAHDPNDFVMGQRHNLEIINIMNDDGTMNESVPERFQNLDRFVVRNKIVEELSNNKILIKTEDHLHKVGHSERTDAVVEPRLSKQWFLKMESFSKPALEVVKNKKINFHPNRWTKIYNHWLENIQDWCISRQLWWGHRIPVWYKDDEMYCSAIPPEGEGWVQDQDVLDTWFSSWIWPIATLGWPNDSSDLKKFYPTQDLVTGPDIIFFWVARMIMSGLYFKNEIPFSNVYFTSIIRDQKGQKMSKSLGNSPDPIDLFDKYGVDAVRVSILMMAPQGLDIQFSEDRLDQGRNFMNKLWNSSRFIFMNLDDNYFTDLNLIDKSDLDFTDLWILSKFNRLILDIDKDYKNYKLNDVIKKIYNFIWKDYCDWYIEFSKSRIYGKDKNSSKIAQSVMVHVLKNILKILHPYAPFITEEIWSNFNSKELLINASWPKCEKSYIDNNNDQNIELLMEIISAIRNMKIDLGISPKKRIDVFCRSDKKGNVLLANELHLKHLLNINKIEVGSDITKPSQSATIVIKNLEIFLPLKGLIDFDKELLRLKTKMNDLESRMNNIKKKLDNENFISKAPKNVVDHEKNKYQSYMNDFEKIKSNYLNLNK
tara:strand:- start:8259 stop:10874 length:2616 start_codon:yes stop_codon:yes gene_type:complete